MTIQEFDHERRVTVEKVDGVPTIVNDRTVLEHLTTLEVLDERTDEFVSIPIRSVITAGSGPAIEFGPFCVGTNDVVDLHNALLSHINTFRAEFRRGVVSA